MGGGYFDQTVTPRCARCTRQNKWRKPTVLPASAENISLDTLSDQNRVAAIIQTSLAESKRKVQQLQSEATEPRRDVWQDAAEQAADNLKFNALAQIEDDEVKTKVG